LERDPADEFMHFGVQAINVKDFVDEVVRLSEFYRICT